MHRFGVDTRQDMSSTVIDSNSPIDEPLVLNMALKYILDGIMAVGGVLLFLALRYVIWRLVESMDHDGTYYY